MREIQKKREAGLFSTFPLLRTNQIISAGVMAAAEMAKETLAGGSSSASSDGGKLELPPWAASELRDTLEARR